MVRQKIVKDAELRRNERILGDRVIAARKFDSLGRALERPEFNNFTNEGKSEFFNSLLLSGNLTIVDRHFVVE